MIDPVKILQTAVTELARDESVSTVEFIKLHCILDRARFHITYWTHMGKPHSAYESSVEVFYNE